MVRIADEENALDGIESRASKLGHGIYSGGGTLRVALKDEAFVRVGLQSSIDLIDDLRVLIHPLIALL